MVHGCCLSSTSPTGNAGDTVVTMVMRCWTYEDNSIQCIDIQEVWKPNCMHGDTVVTRGQSVEQWVVIMN